MHKPTIGCIGQGWIGKHYADEFERRGFSVVRYALEEPFVHNKNAITDCEIVFVAVPTPTTPEGYSYAPVADALKAVASGSTVVVKSTLYPGTTEALQAQFPDLYVLHSPEFLREASAAYDAAHPERNIIGTPENSPEYQERAKTVLSVLPEAPYVKIMHAREAELLKYAGNCFLYTKLVFMNILHDVAAAEGCDWEVVRDALVADPRIGVSHTEPVHYSGHVTERRGIKRGAGGHCFIKDFEAFRQLAVDMVPEADVHQLLGSLIEYNNRLLRESGKDIELLTSVYGEVPPLQPVAVVR